MAIKLYGKFATESQRHGGREEYLIADEHGLTQIFNVYYSYYHICVNLNLSVIKKFLNNKETKMKIYMMTDLEGVAGVINFQDWALSDGRYSHAGWNCRGQS